VAPKPPLFSADALFQMLRQTLSQVPEHRPMNVEISLTEVLMSAVAPHLIVVTSTIARSGLS
jgi:hypothetical protein